ncbi:hypothetical protein BJ980_001126 [Nocardioides daedukensis]|uniref:CAAX prenyl protease 2/Lysostaphin resistance protein A-like domain-containing protein n=1 Tax=Nocardioides daedukensis TaxID=634462 RepID=A0A7Y9S119_9ACTN|nr:type II CAAX endopeptidase family protein [Nocardioides daedukensis]NYG58203.1 hypothetical protein [Nocardioides daedukensis]
MAGQGLGFHQLHRGAKNSWWRSLLGVVLLLLIGLVILPLFLEVAILIGILASGTDDVLADYQRLLDLTNPTPLGLAHLNLVLAGLIPTVFLISWLLHGLRPGWRTSIMPRMRWSFFAVCLGLSFIALFATLVVSALVPAASQGDGAGEISTQVNDFTTTTMQFALVVLFLTPLQAAGEEYAFRGYLTQVFGGHFPTVVAILVPAVLFALAHGAQDPPIFVDRLAFGIVSGVLVVLTGGLEAGIAMHVLNNWLAFGLALAFGDLGEALTPTGGTWWSLPVTLTQSLVYLALVLFCAKHLGVKRTVDRAVLAGPRGAV